MNAKIQTATAATGSWLETSLAQIRVRQARELYTQLRDDSGRFDVPYAVRRTMQDAAACIADFAGLFRKPLPALSIPDQNLQPVKQAQPVQQAQSIDPAHEAWVRSLDGWATSPDGTAELAAMEARWEANEMASAAHEWDGTAEF